MMASRQQHPLEALLELISLEKKQVEGVEEAEEAH